MIKVLNTYPDNMAKERKSWIKRIFCRHKWTLPIREEAFYFSGFIVAKYCTKCGDRMPLWHEDKSGYRIPLWRP
jgi:hypothetical protein